MSFLVPGKLVDTAPAQACCRSALADGQSSLVGGHDGPEPFLFCVSQTGRSETQPCLELLFPTDAVSEGLTSFHALEDSGLARNCPVN
jgi:hypothetical protein